MKSDKKPYELDVLLKGCLHTEEMPDDCLHQRIMQEWKESTDMKKKRSYKAAAAAIVCIGALSAVTVHAAMRFLTPDEAAEEMGYEEVADLFREEGAISVNETQNGKEYAFTLLGMTEGENLLSLDEDGNAIEKDHFYAVVGISALDGSPLTKEEFWSNGEGYFISPLIQGLEPWRYNVAAMDGGYTEIEADGVVYRMIDCDSIACFADREIYLCVLDKTLYEKEAYDYDEQNGVIVPNPEYEGTNLIFRLPIPESKADPEKAAQYIEKMERMWEENDGESVEETGEDEGTLQDLAESFIDHPEASADYLAFLKASHKGEENLHSVLEKIGMEAKDSQTVEEKDGEYLFEWDAGEGDVDSTVFYPEEFENGNSYSAQYEESETEAVLKIELAEKNADGTVTCTIYKKEYGF